MKNYRPGEEGLNSTCSMSSRATNRFQDFSSKPFFAKLSSRLWCRMLSPKMQRMQRSIRINDGQLLGLAEKARFQQKLSKRRKEIENTFLAYLLAPTSWCSTIWSNPLDFNGIENSIELNRLLCFWDRLNSRAKPIGKWYIRFTMQAALKMEITNSFRIRRPTAWGKDSAFLSLQTFRKLFHNGKHIEGLVLNTLWRLDPTTAVEIISASECHCFSLECILEN